MLSKQHSEVVGRLKRDIREDEQILLKEKRRIKELEEKIAVKRRKITNYIDYVMDGYLEIVRDKYLDDAAKIG